MIALHPDFRIDRADDIVAQAIFAESARVMFATAYPDMTVRLNHRLTGHPLFSRAALAALADRMPTRSVEHNYLHFLAGQCHAVSHGPGA